MLAEREIDTPLPPASLTKEALNQIIQMQPGTESAARAHFQLGSLHLEGGSIEIASYVAPLTLFIWGGNRVLPVSLTRYSISEEMFDNHLNPIRATVTLGLRALSYSDLDQSHRGYHLFLAYQQAKETMAQRGRSGNANELTGVNLDRL